MLPQPLRPSSDQSRIQGYGVLIIQCCQGLGGTPVLRGGRESVAIRAPVFFSRDETVSCAPYQ